MSCWDPPVCHDVQGDLVTNCQLSPSVVHASLWVLCARREVDVFMRFRQQNAKPSFLPSMKISTRCGNLEVDFLKLISSIFFFIVNIFRFFCGTSFWNWRVLLSCGRNIRANVLSHVVGLSGVAPGCTHGGEWDRENAWHESGERCRRDRTLIRGRLAGVAHLPCKCRPTPGAR